MYRFRSLRSSFLLQRCFGYQNETVRKLHSEKRDLINYDVIVVGLGATGCATLYQLARLGLKVLGIERREKLKMESFSITPFDFHCRPEYFRMLDRSINLWQRLEDTTDKEFINTTGSLYCGVFYDEIFDGVEASGQDYEELRGFKALKRFPQLRVPAREHLLYIDNGGVINKAEALNSLFHAAIASGAKTRFHEEVIEWNSDNQTVEVVTKKCSYNCKTLVLCCGSSLHNIIPELQNIFVRRHELMFGYKLRSFFAENAMPQVPVFHYDIDEEHEVLSFSHPLDESDVFFSLRYSRPLEYDAETLSDPEEIMWNELAQSICPGINKLTPYSKSSFTSNGIIDGHFILDWHPQTTQVVLACVPGELGFHCSPAVAEVISFMITDKNYAKQILEPFSLWRESLRVQIPRPFYPVLSRYGHIIGE